MLIENTGLTGWKEELAHLDESMSELGFVRWAWDYNKASYDFKFEDKDNQPEDCPYGLTLCKVPAVIELDKRNNDARA